MSASLRQSLGRRAHALKPLLIAAVLLANPALAAAPAPVSGHQGMVVTPQVDASRAGAAILRAGGNAIDAAVAISLALSVSDPHHSGIGGGGFLLIRLANGDAFAVDARETAPAAATRDMYREPGVAEDASRWGGLAIATPGLVAGLELARERWGRLEFPALVEPAIRIAEEGFALGRAHARSLAYWDARLADRFPATAAIQLPVRGQPPEALVGTVLRQPEKAETLRHLASAGPGAFYKGELAERMVAAAREAGGILSVEDLAGYQPAIREPTRGAYRGHEVLSFPPPSSGGLALVSMLQILEGFDLAERGAGSSRSFHVIAEAMKLAFADRAAYLGDPDFVEIPAWLATPRYAATLRARINPPRWERSPLTWHLDEVAQSVEGPGEAPHDGGTTHFSVVDAEGNAVSATQTINLLFGSGITVPGTGIVLNNEMDDFSIALDTPNAFGLVDTRGANAVAPGKRPLSSMTPTIVLRDGKPFLVTGSPGGPRIITTTLLSILNVIDYKMDVQAAVSAPRIHHQWIPDRVLVEPDISADVIEALRARGHNVEVSGRFWSSAQAIAIDAERFYGGTDPRGDGAAIAP